MTSERTGKGGVDELHILWISEGMSCDGATVSMKAAAQPSIEDVARGLLPGPPNVHVQDKALAYDGIEERAARAHVRLRAEGGATMSSPRAGETGNTVVGEPDVDPSTPSHVRGVHQGTWSSERWRRRRVGARTTEVAGIVGPRRSTGIVPEARWPIDPRTPKLTPP